MYTSWGDYKIDCQKGNGKIETKTQDTCKVSWFWPCSALKRISKMSETFDSGRKWTRYQLLLWAVELSQDFAHPPTVIFALQWGCHWVSFHLNGVCFITASLPVKQSLLEPSHRLSSPLCCVQNKPRKGYRGKSCSRCKLCLRHPCSYSSFCSWAW